ncbi:MAG: YafY family transcriptional regulator [Clostridia bacterium]|nr:YafY family transcriptional regulator [Clostridia bacterium]
MQNDILFGILLTLLTNKKCTARELATKYEMSVRTIYRYLDTLNQAGVPLISYAGANGGIAIADNFKVDKTYFSEQEYNKIISALGAFQQDDNQLIIDKFKALSQQQEVQYTLQSDTLFVDAPLTESMKNKTSVFSDAVYNKKICEITYHSRKGEVTTRKILPHAITIREGQWYVYAFCQKRKAFRLFKLSRVYSVVLSDETFERLPLPDKNEIFASYENLQRISLAISVKDKCRLDVEEWLGIENVTKSGDEYFAITKQYLSDELISKLLSFGDGINILAPQQVKEAVKQKLLSALKNYE